MKETAVFVLFVLLLFGTAPLLGRYMAAIFRDDSPTSPALGGLERLIYRLCGIDPTKEMSWREYARSLLLFNALGFAFLFLLQLAQGGLPLNPQHLPGVDFALALNTTASFVTNTNWQAYGGENTMSYLTQTLGLTAQNFISAATGNAALLALIRGVTRHTAETIGNFWRDATRTIVYLLLPLSCLFAFFLVSQGVIQNIDSYVEATTLQNEKQVIPMGPVASQVAIKQLGTNGGGYFNANSAHPFENPTPLSNFFELFAILLIPAATVFMYGCLLSSKKEALVLFVVMTILWLGGSFAATFAESTPNLDMPVHTVMEGKETRLGSFSTSLWAVATSATSNGSVNGMLDSLSPITGGVALFNLILGEVIFGGVGVGLCSMLMFVLLTVFLSGLMVGRTPEYLTKKIEKREIQWVMLAILAPPVLTLLGSGIAAILPSALSSLGNAGPHGLTEILYATASAAANNGSAFAGLNANTPFFNYTLAAIMLLSRLSILLPSVAIAGLLAAKRKLKPTPGSFSTSNVLFGGLLLSIILIVGALTFFPALSLGPILEYLLVGQGVTF